MTDFLQGLPVKPLGQPAAPATATTTATPAQQDGGDFLHGLPTKRAGPPPLDVSQVLGPDVVSGTAPPATSTPSAPSAPSGGVTGRFPGSAITSPHGAGTQGTSGSGLGLSDIMALANTATNTAYAGWGDRIAAFADAHLGNPSEWAYETTGGLLGEPIPGATTQERYQHQLALYQQQRQQEAQQHPIASAGANVTGAILNPLNKAGPLGWAATGAAESVANNPNAALDWQTAKKAGTQAVIDAATGKIIEKVASPVINTLLGTPEQQGALAAGRAAATQPVITPLAKALAGAGITGAGLAHLWNNPSLSAIKDVGELALGHFIPGLKQLVDLPGQTWTNLRTGLTNLATNKADRDAAIRYFLSHPRGAGGRFTPLPPGGIPPFPSESIAPVVGGAGGQEAAQGISSLADTYSRYIPPLPDRLPFSGGGQ